jgi:hypothetical protein
MLDVNRLSQKGCLRSGCSSACQWILGNEIASINLRAEADGLHLSYTLPTGHGEWENMFETIAIVHLRCRFGGSRPYFLCPGPGDGTQCGRRITKLHLSRRYFLCRHCNQLGYASQYEQPWQRALRRFNKLRQRLDIAAGVAEPLPDKPKGMWVRTYGCLLDGILQAEMLAHEAQANKINRLLERVENDIQADQPNGKRCD